MSVHRPIADVRPFAFPPQCQRRAPGTGGRCTDRAEWWVVSPDGMAITTYCDGHARAVRAEYDCAAAATTDPELLSILAGWTLAPVEVLP